MQKYIFFSRIIKCFNENVDCLILNNINIGNSGFKRARNSEYVDKSPLISIVNATQIPNREVAGEMEYAVRANNWKIA